MSFLLFAAQTPATFSFKLARSAAFFDAALRIPTKPATHSNRKPATDSDLKPAGVPI